MPSLTPPAADGLPVLAPDTRQALEQWLDEHAATSRGVWLRLRDGGPLTLAAARALALAYGWVAGQRATDDPPWSRQRFTPRTARTRWSQADRDATEDLLDRGLLRPGGLREVELARADGRWDAAYPPVSGTEVPDDLRAALDAAPPAAVAFDRLDARNRAAVLQQVASAKRVAVRARRVEDVVRMLAEGRTPYPPRDA